MNKHFNLANVLKKISKVISWILFGLLLIAAVFLIYYYVATKIYAKKGAGYEPKFSIYTIISESMTPKIKKYDAVVNVRVDNPEDIKKGDVITFISTSLMSPGLTITHRVIEVTKDSEGNVCYRTKGDFNPVADDSCAKFNNILGKLMFKIPQLGRVQYLLASKAGWLMFILIPALVIITKDILRITKIVNIKDKAIKISEKPEPDEKKAKQEKLRKEELKRKLLKEEVRDNEKYYEEPKIITIDKSKKKSLSSDKTKSKRKEKNR